MKLHYKNFTQAWEKMNELLINPPKNFVQQYNVKVVNNAIYAYNVTISVEKPVLDPNFDFGRKFHYTAVKWSSLVKNYISKRDLRLFRTIIAPLVNGRKTFSEFMTFDNSYKNGKNCLMMLLVQRRASDKVLTLNLYMRAGEVTKRLAFDMLLLQRLGEYLIPKGKKWEAIIHINQIFNDQNVLLMYLAHKNIKAQLNPDMLNKLKKFENSSLEEIRYKIHKRVYKVLRDDVYEGEYPSTLAKECRLTSSTE